MNLPSAHIERIKDLGYTDSEARFLYMVAVFSGYFTLGHFRVFTGSAYGNAPPPLLRNFLSKVTPPSATTCGEAPSIISFPGLFMVRSRKITSATERSIRLISCAPAWSFVLGSETTGVRALELFERTRWA
jgi:hypothetical protein